MSSRAGWTKEVEPVTDLGSLAGYLRLTEVSQKVDLSPKTIQDLLSRPVITNPANPQAPISRPATRFGSEPLYTQEQVDQVLDIRASKTVRHLGGGDKPLPRVGYDEAGQLDLVSIREIAEIAERHEQTVRRWAKDDGSFPPALALRSRPQNKRNGVPEVVRDRKAIVEWLERNDYLPGVDDDNPTSSD